MAMRGRILWWWGTNQSLNLWLELNSHFEPSETRDKEGKVPAALLGCSFWLSTAWVIGEPILLKISQMLQEVVSFKLIQFLDLVYRKAIKGMEGRKWVGRWEQDFGDNTEIPAGNGDENTASVRREEGGRS